MFFFISSTYCSQTTISFSWFWSGWKFKGLAAQIQKYYGNKQKVWFSIVIVRFKRIITDDSSRWRARLDRYVDFAIRLHGIQPIIIWFPNANQLFQNTLKKNLWIQTVAFKIDWIFFFVWLLKRCTWRKYLCRFDIQFEYKTP